MSQAADIGFVGPAYEAPMVLQDAQRCINWYIEIAETKNSKEPVALLGCPGLNAVIDSGITGPVRGAWVLPGGNQALAVVSNQVLLITVTVPATQTSIAQFGFSIVGTLLTNYGPVSIRDNGVVFNGRGGYAVLVDGQYGYYYQLSGAARTVTFTGGVTNTTPTITVTTIPAGLVITPNLTLSDSSGFIPANTAISSVDFNAVTITMNKSATGTNAADTITATIPVFGQITDPAFLAASRIGFIEGWLLFNQVGTRTFFTNATTPYTLLFAGSFYALKDSSTDNLVTHQEHDREWWLIGERTAEVWFNSGGQNFAFSRIPGVGPQIGCSAPHSLTRIGTRLAWLGRNEQGENIVVITEQYSWKRMSNHGVEHAISSYPVVSDAIGYAYEEEGHLFYMLIFPTADTTWVLDLTATEKWGAPVWHQRAAYDPVLGVFHRHRSNAFMNFANVRMVGDYQNGLFYQMSRNFYSDNGAPLRCVRRSPTVWSRENRDRVFQGQLQIQFTPGVGLQVGQGSNPQAMLRFSSDGGFSWGTELWSSIGAAGKTKFRAIWRMLTWAWDRVYELTFTDPVPRDIIGASLSGEGEE